MTHRESGSKLSCGVCFKIQTATINAGGWDIHIYAFSASALLVVAMVFMMYYMSTAYRRGYDQHQRTLQEFLANTEISSPHRNPLREVDSANDIDYIDPIYYGFTQAVSYTFVLQAFGYLFGRSIPYPAVTWGIMFNLANCSDNFVCIHLCRLRCRRSSGTPRSAKMSFLLSLGLTTLMTVFVVGRGFSINHSSNLWPNNCPYCGPRTPMPIVKWPLAGFSLVYFFLAMFVTSSRSKTLTWRAWLRNWWAPQTEREFWRGSFAMFLSLSYGCAAIGELRASPAAPGPPLLLSYGCAAIGVFLVDGVVWSYDIGYCFLDLGVLGYCLMYAPLLLYTFRADSKFMRKYHLRQALDTHGRHGASNSGGMYEAVLPEDWADSDSQEASAAVLKRLNDILKLLESSQMRFIKWDELDIGSRLGGGSFGEVFVAQWQGAQVAVKCLVDNGNGLAEVYDFLREKSSQSSQQRDRATRGPAPPE
ncbi:hypothetical protein CYMTET_47590 [Cymbomonas tetramitiformis]|uniref:Protein kinase domain-containing protein n=1 Tax=Cymbomonas tetramitiformis TaxID=36881 RepID=A0AAE0BTY3_9CHLO|nr:hypothetical protein CYMTET_47590 [Cymbomonas tetramitiformis]